MIAFFHRFKLCSFVCSRGLSTRSPFRVSTGEFDKEMGSRNLKPRPWQKGFFCSFHWELGLQSRLRSCVRCRGHHQPGQTQVIWLSGWSSWMPILQAGLGHGLMPILPKHSLTLPCSALDNQFRMSILERLEQMERRMAEMTGSQQHKQGSGGGSSGGGTGSGNGGSQAQVRVLEGHRLPDISRFTEECGSRSQVSSLPLVCFLAEAKGRAGGFVVLVLLSI